MSTVGSKGPMTSLLRWLDDKRIDYEVHEHARALTALATARAEGVDPTSFEKVIWVRTAEGRDDLVVLDADDHLDMRKTRALLKTKKVSLVDEDEIERLAPECDPGAMPAVGILFGLPTYADLATDEWRESSRYQA